MKDTDSKDAPTQNLENKQQTNSGAASAKAPETAKTSSEIVSTSDPKPAEKDTKDEGEKNDKAMAAGAEANEPAELRTDGPTLTEFKLAGYDAANYPPEGYAEVPEPILSGFGGMRHWLNHRLRQRPGGVTLLYAGHEQTVTEITPDGHIRIEFEGAFNLVTLDERFIPKLLKQLVEDF